MGSLQEGICKGKPGLRGARIGLLEAASAIDAV